MAKCTAAETVRVADPIIHDVGSAFMLDRATSARSAEHGYDDAFSFYFVGRGGVLGDVDADLVAAAMGWFEPALVRAMWERGVAVAGAREASRRYAMACAAWGRDHLTDLTGLDRLAELTERVVVSAEGSGLPLFAGWRAEPRVDDVPGRAMQLVHVLREWRGALHLVGTTAAGLSPLEAILTNEGEGQARFFGWRGPLPDCSALKARHEQAEQTTNSLSEQVYERALEASERAELRDLLLEVKATVLA